MVSVWSNTQYVANLSGTFYSNGGLAMLTFTGSAYAATAGTTIAVNLLIDGTIVAKARILANNAQSHMSLIPVVEPAQLLAGKHTATISWTSPTTVDGNDYFTLVVDELAPLS